MTDEEIRAVVDEKMKDLAPILEAITVKLGNKYGLDKIPLTATDTNRIGFYLLDMQEQTLELGIRTGMEITSTLIERAEKPND